MKPWEMEWHEFEMPDGLKAQYAFDGKEVSMMVDDEDLPHGMTIPQRMNECYEHFFTNIYPKL